MPHRETSGGETPDAVIRRADSLRDNRDWAAAAALYRQAVRQAPGLAAIWVQLGHACKESGDLEEAEAAYRRALELTPDEADTHLQLGHLLKLSGRRPEAVAAYARALRADREFTPALTELIALGEGWAAEQASGIGAHMLADMARAVSELRGGLRRLERALPDVAALIAIPTAKYDLFRSCYRLPPPPEAAASVWAVVVLNVSDPDQLPALLRGLAALDRPLVNVALHSSNPAVLHEARFDGWPVEARGGDPPVVPDCEWLLVMDARITPVASAIGWFDWAASEVASDAIYADEDHVEERPVLKAAYDPEAELPPYRHGFVALRAAAAGRVPAEAWQSDDPIAAIVDAAAAAGGVAHLPRILGSRRAELPPIARAKSATKSNADGRIGVVIPTRNGELARSCIGCLVATADEPSRLDIVVLDNGSGDVIASLGPAFRVLRDDRPFNWSRLSNTGAAACATDNLVFLNDDVELTSPGWDTVLLGHLRRPEIAAVGARLLYPDGGVQHGGMVFGPGGRVEHEGVSALGFTRDIAARWATRRRVGAVTGAFLACRRNEFMDLGGFDETLPIWFNDVDFCLRARRAGRLILYAPEIVGTHHESRTLAGHAHDRERMRIWEDSLGLMRHRWGEALRTDPGFNPHFARTGRPFEAMLEPSLLAVREHLVLSSMPNPWSIMPA